MDFYILKETCIKELERLRTDLVVIKQCNKGVGAKQHNSKSQLMTKGSKGTAEMQLLKID